MTKYRIKKPVAAVVHRPGGQKEPASLPAGVEVDESSRHSSTLEGKVGVYWRGVHYSISLRDLLTNAEATRTVAKTGR
jgi:hypothetical protein